jgi:hypothetical protein
MVTAANQSPASVNTSSGGNATPTPDAPPIISITGDNPATIHIGDTYNDLGATITGPQADLNLGIQTFVGTTPIAQAVIDTSAPATYHIYYVATDQSGLTATSSRTVVVQAPSSATSDAASSTEATSTTQ